MRRRWLGSAQDPGTHSAPVFDPAQGEVDYGQALEQAYGADGADVESADDGDDPSQDPLTVGAGDQEPLPEIDLDELLLGASAQDGDGPLVSPYEEFGERNSEELALHVRGLIAQQLERNAKEREARAAA